MDFASILRRSCHMYRDNVAVTFVEPDHTRHQTYAELAQRAARLANALSDLGLQPGDRVAVLTDNRLDTIEQVAGIALGGFVRASMYTMNPAATNAKLLDLVGARACIVQGKYAADLATVRGEVPSLEHLIIVDPVDATEGLEYEALLGASSPEFPDVVVDPDADHIIRFSAGTTGMPKGIVHSNAGWLAMSNEFALGLPLFTENDAYLVASPLSHAAGLLIWLFLERGARYVVLNAFDPSRFLDTIENQRCTATLVVPTMIHLLAAAPGAKDRDLSSLRAVTYGAAPITEAALRAGIDLWGNIMYQSYGQSEALPVSRLSPQYHRTGGSQRDRRMLTSAGRPSPNVMITVRDEHDRMLPPGEVGEICAHTPGAMKAIYGDPDATAARFTADGAVRTKDMGYLDEDGFLHVVDRKEDLIISGGFNIWPLEIENALAAHAAVQEVAVVGVPDEKWGEAVFAAVYPRDGAMVTEEELLAFALERVGPVKKPKRIVIAAEPLPKSAVGKLLRRRVRDRYAHEAVS